METLRKAHKAGSEMNFIESHQGGSSIVTDFDKVEYQKRIPTKSKKILEAATSMLKQEIRRSS